jgi:acyl-CoA synthetase (AMP-forming)/AMP-acid ligase II
MRLYGTWFQNLFTGWGVSGNGTFKLSDDFNIQSITAYREYRQKWGTDDDVTPDLNVVGQGFIDLSFWFFSQELRFNGKIGDSHAKERLGGVKAPKAAEFVPAIPRTAAGKMDKKELRKKYWGDAQHMVN